MMEKDQIITFKTVIMQEQTPIRWEDKIPDNRAYKAQNKNVILKAFFNNPKLSEIVEKCFPDELNSFFFLELK